MEVTREIGFDMGHRVPNHHSKCRNVHGHRYLAEITLTGDLVKEHDTNEGMVIDFSHIKTIAQTWIDDYLDHGYMGHMALDIEIIELCRKSKWKFIPVTFIPTAENIAKYLFDALGPKFQDQYGTGLRLSKIKLWETPNCNVTYEPSRQ